MTHPEGSLSGAPGPLLQIFLNISFWRPQGSDLTYQGQQTGLGLLLGKVSEEGQQTPAFSKYV